MTADDLHVALAMHVKRAPTAELAQTLDILAGALVRRLSPSRTVVDVGLAIRHLHQALADAEGAPRAAPGLRGGA